MNTPGSETVDKPFSFARNQPLMLGLGFALAIGTAGVTYAGLHRWLEDEPLPVSGAVAKGYVCDLSGRKVAGVHVEVDGAAHAVVTDAQGRFEVQGIPEGKHWLNVEIPTWGGVALPLTILGEQVYEVGRVVLFKE